MPKDILFVGRGNEWFPDSARGSMIAVKVGEKGYFPIYTMLGMKELNDEQDVPDDIVMAAVGASMFGWHTEEAERAAKYLGADAAGRRLIAKGYDLEELERDNPYNQWDYDGSIE